MVRRAQFWFLFCIAVLIGGSADSVPRRHQFNDELCTYEIRYNTDRISDEQVKGTIELLYNVSLSSAVSGYDVPQNQQEIDRIDTAKLDAACAARTAEIERVQMVKLDGLEAFRRSILDSVQDECTLARIGRLGYRTPSTLREHPASAKCSSYVDALEGKTDINAVYNKLVTSQCAQNLDRKRCLADTKKTAADPVAQRIHLQVYGWHNCINQFNRQVDESQRMRLMARFQKQYGVKRLRCERP